MVLKDEVLAQSANVTLALQSVLGFRRRWHRRPGVLSPKTVCWRQSEGDKRYGKFWSSLIRAKISNSI